MPIFDPDEYHVDKNICLISPHHYPESQQVSDATFMCYHGQSF